MVTELPILGTVITALVLSLCAVGSTRLYRFYRYDIPEWDNSWWSNFDFAYNVRSVGRWGCRLLLECLWIDIFFRLFQIIAPNHTLGLPALYALIAGSRLLVYLLGQYLYWLYCRAQARRAA